MKPEKCKVDKCKREVFTYYGKIIITLEECLVHTDVVDIYGNFRCKNGLFCLLCNEPLRASQRRFCCGAHSRAFYKKEMPQNKK